MDADLDTLATALYVITDDVLRDHPERRPAASARWDRAEAQRRRAAHAGGVAGVARLHQRDPLDPVRPTLTCGRCSRSCRNSPATTSGCAGWPTRWPGWSVGSAPRPAIVDDTVWVVDSTPVECGRSRETAQRSDLAGWAELRLLRLALPVLLGFAAASALHPARAARRLGADRRQGRRTPRPDRHPHRHPGPGRTRHRADPDRGQELLRPRVRGRTRRRRDRPAPPDPQPARPPGPANASSNPCARSSNRSTTPSKANSTSNATAAAPSPASAPAIAQRLLALTAAIWHNDRIGQTIRRSLIAYDH